MLFYASRMPPTRTEVVYEVRVKLQGRLKAAPPLMCDNTEFADVIMFKVTVIF